METLRKNIIAFLVREQANNGSYIGLTSSDPISFNDATPCPATFTSSIILSSLATIPFDDAAHQIMGRLAQFLLAEKSEYWTYNYWSRTSEYAQKMPYPDDLDDTSCALASLTLHDQSLLTGEALASFVSVLTQLEVAEGGPYRTWLVPPDAPEIWRDVDAAVNCNIAYFLSLHEVNLPALTRYLENIIAESDYHSPYYPTPYPILYFLSRAYSGPQKEKAIHYLLQQEKDGAWENPLNTALAISALLNFGYAPSKLTQTVEKLQDTCRKDAWKPYPFYVGINPGQGKQRHYAGSAALTAALCLEAIERYAVCARKKKSASSRHNQITRIKHTITRELHHRIHRLGTSLGSEVESAVQHVLNNDHDGQVTGLAYYTAKALGMKLRPVREMILQLGAINVYGWTAYGLYDDLMDGDGDVSALPAANLCLREMTLLLNEISTHLPGFGEYYTSVLDQIEEVNLWEARHCHAVTDTQTLEVPGALPDYGDLSILADRSFGHALGPIALLLRAGFSLHSEEVVSLIQFFRHALIARQLNDDAHDWEEDLKRGRLTPVVTRLIQKSNQVTINLLDLQPWRERFWHEEIVMLCDEIENELGAAREALNRCAVIKETRYLTQFLDPIEKTVHDTRLKRQDVLDFVGAYGKITEGSITHG